ncbi:MAG: PorV/PorQ family protein [Candidatus Eisenbacteria bacterium]|nr:PorV/PorQ family protein [Candidatus Eisenbacteria bacterium]
MEGGPHLLKKLPLLLLILALSAPQASSTEIFEKVGTVGFQFLEIGAGPRGVAMGEAMVAASEGIESLYWNPAGLRHLSGPTALFSYGTWPADITHQFVGVAMEPGFIPGIVGVSVTTLSMDPMLVRTATNPNGVGVEFEPGDIAVGVSYTRVFTDRFSAGGTLRWVHSSLGDLSTLGEYGLADYSVDTVVGDFGTLYNTGFRSLRIGLCIQNMGAEAAYIDESVPVPATFKFGVSMNVFETPGQTVKVATEFKHPSDTSEKINVGAEYSLNRTYFLRAGYKLNYDEETFTAGGGARVTVGALGRLGVDYSYSDFGYLGAVHRVGLSLQF